MEKNFYVYILTNYKNGTLYIGVTNNLFRRIGEHQGGLKENSFTKKYKVDKLVYYEIFSQVKDAIRREKQLKAGSRDKKIKLIESINQEWNDLFKLNNNG